MSAFDRLHLTSFLNRRIFSATQNVIRNLNERERKRENVCLCVCECKVRVHEKESESEREREWCAIFTCLSFQK